VREPGQKHPGIDRAVRPFEHTADCNHPNHTLVTHEAMFDKTPLAIPADQARLNLEGLKYPEIAAKLGDGIANHGEGFLPPGNAKGTGEREPVDPADIGERKISTVVDVEIDSETRVVVNKSTLGAAMRPKPIRIKRNQGNTARAFVEVGWSNGA